MTGRGTLSLVAWDPLGISVGDRAIPGALYLSHALFSCDPSDVAHPSSISARLAEQLKSASHCVLDDCVPRRLMLLVPTRCIHAAMSFLSKRAPVGFQALVIVLASRSMSRLAMIWIDGAWPAQERAID